MKRSYPILLVLAAAFAVIAFFYNMATGFGWFPFTPAGLFVLYGLANFEGTRFHRKMNRHWIPGLYLGIVGFTAVAAVTLFMGGVEVPMNGYHITSFISLGIAVTVLPCMAFFIRGMEFEMSPEMENAVMRRWRRGFRVRR